MGDRVAAHPGLSVQAEEIPAERERSVRGAARRRSAWPVLVYPL